MLFGFCGECLCWVCRFGGLSFVRVLPHMLLVLSVFFGGLVGVILWFLVYVVFVGVLV